LSVFIYATVLAFLPIELQSLFENRQGPTQLI